MSYPAVPSTPRVRGMFLASRDGDWTLGSLFSYPYPFPPAYHRLPEFSLIVYFPLPYPYLTLAVPPCWLAGVVRPSVLLVVRLAVIPCADDDWKCV